MIQIKVFYNTSFPEDRCEVLTTDENEVATCDDLMQIIRDKLECLGTWRNVITCAYLFGVSFRPRGLNSNTLLNNGNCFARLSTGPQRLSLKQGTGNRGMGMGMGMGMGNGNGEREWGTGMGNGNGEREWGTGNGERGIFKMGNL